MVIDAGLGVCDLRHDLEHKGLLSPPGGERECELIVTHAHFDHSGGAHHFDKVTIPTPEITPNIDKYNHQPQHSRTHFPQNPTTVEYDISRNSRWSKHRGFSVSVGLNSMYQTPLWHFHT